MGKGEGRSVREGRETNDEIVLGIRGHLAPEMVYGGESEGAGWGEGKAGDGEGLGKTNGPAGGEEIGDDSDRGIWVSTGPLEDRLEKEGKGGNEKAGVIWGKLVGVIGAEWKSRGKREWEEEMRNGRRGGEEWGKGWKIAGRDDDGDGYLTAGGEDVAEIEKRKQVALRRERDYQKMRGNSLRH